MMIRALFITCLALFCSINMIAQESSIAECSDGIDNDGDGLIDLNDDDCSCGDLMMSSLIPNPSFEEMTCCPQAEAELNCANDWIQASAATTDYVHTCGVLGNPFLGYEAPVPFPEGEGAIGFRDGKPNAPNFKEYTGACLTGPMTQGVEYRLDFFVGFHDAPGSLSFDMAVFATADCNNIPFGGTDVDFGCPTNGPGWVQIGDMTVSGSNEWKNVVFDFMADQPYSAIALGPSCETNDSFLLDPYFYFDRLVLAERSMFSVPLNIEGDICDDNLLLSVDEIANATYQWFRNGIAINGETNAQLSILNDQFSEADYEALILTDTGCRNTDVYSVVIPAYESEIAETICFGDTYNLFGFILDSTDVYTLTATASDGCDSIVELTLTVLNELSTDLFFEICDSKQINVNNEIYDSPGQYIQVLNSVEGCDSTLNINIEAILGSFTQLEFAICNSDSIRVNNEIYDSGGQYTQVLNSVNGCDSTLNINITEFLIDTTQLIFEICRDDSIGVNGVFLSAAGTYEQTINSSLGCDSVIFVTINNFPESVIEEIHVICGSNPIEIAGVTYTESGQYIGESFSDGNGCLGYNVLKIVDDPNCENCGSENPFVSKVSISKLSLDYFEVKLTLSENDIFDDILTHGELQSYLANYIMNKNLLSENKIVIDHFRKEVKHYESASKSFEFISNQWISERLPQDIMNISIAKLKQDINGEFQMLNKQIDKLRIGNRMSHN